MSFHFRKLIVGQMFFILVIFRRKTGILSFIENTDSFLKHQTVWIRDEFALRSSQNCMKSADIFNPPFGGEVFVLNPDEITDFIRESKKHDNPAGDIA